MLSILEDISDEHLTCFPYTYRDYSECPPNHWSKNIFYTLL